MIRKVSVKWLKNPFSPKNLLIHMSALSCQWFSWVPTIFKLSRLCLFLALIWRSMLKRLPAFIFPILMKNIYIYNIYIFHNLTHKLRHWSNPATALQVGNVKLGWVGNTEERFGGWSSLGFYNDPPINPSDHCRLNRSSSNLGLGSVGWEWCMVLLKVARAFSSWWCLMWDGNIYMYIIILYGILWYTVGV